MAKRSMSNLTELAHKPPTKLARINSVTIRSYPWTIVTFDGDDGERYERHRRRRHGYSFTRWLRVDE